MSYLERVLGDSADRPSWLLARSDVIGASDAAGFAKIESVSLYTRAKLKSGHFGGNAYTESGNRWEPLMLDFYGIPRNTLLVHAEGEPGYAATPDGVERLANGELVLAEVKAKHDRVVNGPTRGELRQVWWAQYVMGAAQTKFIWNELVDGVPRRLEPHIVIVDRDDIEIQKMLRIARPVLDGVRRGRQFEREMRTV